jgi:cytochrome c556
MTFTRSLLLSTLLSIAAAGTAYADMKPEDAIKTRQAGYHFMDWNMAKIKAMAVDNSEEFDTKKMQAAANAIAAIANSGMGALYVSGTEHNIGDVKTRAKPEIFTDKEGVKKVAVKFIQAANDMAKVAAGDDVFAIADQFKVLGASCKACHDHYRKD